MCKIYLWLSDETKKFTGLNEERGMFMVVLLMPTW